MVWLMVRKARCAVMVTAPFAVRRRFLVLQRGLVLRCEVVGSRKQFSRRLWGWAKENTANKPRPLKVPYRPTRSRLGPRAALPPPEQDKTALLFRAAPSPRPKVGRARRRPVASRRNNMHDGRRYWWRGRGSGARSFELAVRPAPTPRRAWQRARVLVPFGMWARAS